jgi:hypothetical protein
VADLRIVPPRVGSIDWMVMHLALIYGTSRVFDFENGIEMPMRNAAIAFTTARLKDWLAHPQRRLVLRADVPRQA